MNRDCKDCKTNKPIEEFEMTNKTKKLYRRICKKCRVIKRRNYMKDYHIKHYVKKVRTKKKV